MTTDDGMRDAEGKTLEPTFQDASGDATLMRQEDVAIDSHEKAVPRPAESTLPVTYRGQTNDVCYNEVETLADFAQRCCSSGLFGTLIKDGLKLMITPGRMYTDPFSVTHVEMGKLVGGNSRIRLIGVTAEEATQDAESANDTRRRQNHTATGTSGATATPNRSRNWKQIQEEAKYTFHSIRPLPYLPNPEKSERFLERLARDPGIKASMRKHQFSVGLLTEMNPAEHTTQESRTLGLNRNRGEVIELRLRTDRYDGYRDYKVIRKTLCHELSHNVWGDHDRNFWDLTKQIEDEVDRNDWKHGGHKLASDEFYNPDDSYGEAEHADAGGWSGGSFVLGSSDADGNTGLSRREILARAAMSRMDKQTDAAKKARES